VRRALLAAANAQSQGIEHPTVDNPRLYRVRPVEILLPEGVDWFEATEQHRASDARVRLENFVTTGLV
jgi:hypothetical protein